MTCSRGRARELHPQSGTRELLRTELGQRFEDARQVVDPEPRSYQRRSTTNPHPLSGDAGLNVLYLERVTGIEPASRAWKARALPLSYTRRYGWGRAYHSALWLGLGSSATTRRGLVGRPLPRRSPDQAEYRPAPSGRSAAGALA